MTPEIVSEWVIVGVMVFMMLCVIIAVVVKAVGELVRWARDIAKDDGE